MKQEVIALAQDLIHRPSISPKDEGCQQVIADRFLQLHVYLPANNIALFHMSVSLIVDDL